VERDRPLDQAFDLGDGRPGHDAAVELWNPRSIGARASLDHHRVAARPGPIRGPEPTALHRRHVAIVQLDTKPTDLPENDAVESESMSTATRPHRAATVTTDGAALRTALAIRGLDQQTFAGIARLSEATISKAVRGGPITGPTLARIGRALASVPPVDLPEGIASLLLRDPR